MRLIDALDTKATQVLSFASATLIVFGLIMGIIGKTIPIGTTAVPIGTVILYILAFVAYGVLAYSSVTSYQVKQWSFGPYSKAFQSYGETPAHPSLGRRIANEYMQSIATNDECLVTKAEHLARALRWLPVEALLLTAGALLVFA